MKKKFKVNMILSIISISIFYSFVVGVKPANATCVDVTKDPCFCDIFDIPYDGAVNHFLWLMYRRDDDKLNYLRTLNIQIDSCNLYFRNPCVKEKKYLYFEDCLYFKHAKYANDVEFGFNKVVNVGDTISIDDFDSKNTEIITALEKLDSAICKFRIIVDKFDTIKKNYLEGTLLFDNYYKCIDLDDFQGSMYEIGITTGVKFIQVFDYTVDVDDKEIKDIGLIINQSNSDELWIHYNQFEKNDQVEIYDVLGICQIRSEMNSSAKVLDISGLPRGVYFVKIGNQTSKFMRE